jgi:hypothetical protein
MRSGKNRGTFRLSPGIPQPVISACDPVKTRERSVCPRISRAFLEFADVPLGDRAIQYERISLRVVFRIMARTEHSHRAEFLLQIVHERASHHNLALRVQVLRSRHVSH